MQPGFGQRGHLIVVFEYDDKIWWLRVISLNIDPATCKFPMIQDLALVLEVAKVKDDLITLTAKDDISRKASVAESHKVAMISGVVAKIKKYPQTRRAGSLLDLIWGLCLLRVQQIAVRVAHVNGRPSMLADKRRH